MRNSKISAKFQSLKRVLIEDKKGFMSPGKLRAVRETGAPCTNYATYSQSISEKLTVDPVDLTAATR